MDYSKEVEKIIKERLPPEAQVTSVELEGPEIAVYTKNPQAFFENENFVAKIAFELKKRINIRTDKSLLTDVAQARAKIESLVPKEADIKTVTFNECFSEVVIEAIKPGLVIGKGGETSKKIILETGWTPNIIRAPTSPVEILTGMRYHLNKHAEERKKILKQTAKKIYEVQPRKNAWVRMTALGGFREVGRSCVFLETPQTKILMDCGVNVASREEGMPYLEALNFPMDQLDALIISHSHLDHMGLLPYLFKLGYRGPVYCTPPTRDLMALLQFDYVDVVTKNGGESPYGERDVKEMVKYCIPREYREVTDIAPDMRITFHNAAHILGSASVHVHIGEGDHNLVYSGDIKYGFTRLFDTLDLSYPRVETLIVESTYSGKTDIMPPREDDERKLTRIIKETVAQGGNVLIPVFAVGRGQEIMMVIEDAFRRSELNVKCYVDGLTREAATVHTAYPEYLRQNVQRRILQNDSPFTSEVFHLVSGQNRDAILEEKGNIILASSGMLTGGASLEYFYKMAENPANTLVFVGWQANGSLGRRIQEGMNTVAHQENNGKVKETKINLRVETLEGFSVPYETELMIKKNGEFSLAPIGKIADDYLSPTAEGVAELNDVLVPAFDEKGNVELHEARYIIKHKTTHDHLFIQTKSGRSVQASKGHSVFILKEGQVKTIKTSELKKGDYLIIPMALPESHTLTQIALADHISNKNYVQVEDRLKPLKGGNNRSFISSHCNDMKSLAKFLGYYIAEGHIDYGKCNRPTLSFSYKEEDTLVKDTVECIEKAFGLKADIQRPHATEIQVRVNSSALADFLENIGVGVGAHHKRVPGLVFNLSQENQKEFLKAYFAGDGYYYKNGAKGYLAAKTASKQLVSDLSYLLLQQGIVARLKGPFTERARMLKGHYLKESIAYKIYLAEKDFQKTPHLIGYPPFSVSIKEIMLKDLIPLIQDPEMKKLAGDYVYNEKTKGRKTIGIELLRKMFSNVQSELPAFKTLEKIVNGSIGADEIVEIKSVDRPEFEYDLSVPSAENFVGGFGGICLHNSGHCDKNQLTAYIRNMNPKPKRILVNHGEKTKILAFAKFITTKFHIPSTAMKDLDALRLK